MLQHLTPSNFIQENLETALNAEKGSIMIESALEKDKEQLKLKAPDNIGGLPSIYQGKPFMPSVKPALDANSFKKKNEPKELLVSLQQPAQPKIDPVLPASKWALEDDESDDEQKRSSRGLGLSYSSSGSENAGDGPSKADDVDFTIDASIPVQPDSGMNEEQRSDHRLLSFAFLLIEK